MGNTYKSHLDPLVKLQKKAIRIISKADRGAHTAPLFQTLKVLPIESVYLYCAQLFLFKYHKTELPDIFNDFYTRNSNIHGHITRQSNYFHTIGAKTTSRNNAIRVSGVRIYNYFYDRIDMDCSFVTYKHKLKYHLNNIKVEL